MELGRYATFLNGLPASSLRENPPEENLPGELELQSLWFSGLFGSSFTATDGRTVKLRDLGHWNHGAGPDFTDCCVEVAGERLRGAIELDTDARDWEVHGHGANAAFDDTVLHLSFTGPESECFVRNSRHREIASVRLSLAVALPNLPHRRSSEAHLGRCARPLEEMESERVDDLLREAARYRFNQKSRRLACAVQHHGWECALLHGVAEALGYRVNKIPLRVLAQRLSLAHLRELDPNRRESLLFGVAGFLEGDPRDAVDPQTAAYLRNLWDDWWKMRAGFAGRPALPWKVAGSRPGNHPERRLGALAALLREWSVFVALLKGDPFDLRAVRKFFAGLAHPYWSHHYTLRSGAVESSIALIGDGRATEIFANQIYPLLHHKEEWVWESYLTLPSKLSNQKVKRAALRLFGETREARSFQKKVYQQQGLLQIFEDFCLADDSACEDCPFPEQLKFW